MRRTRGLVDRDILSVIYPHLPLFANGFGSLCPAEDVMSLFPYRSEKDTVVIR